MGQSSCVSASTQRGAYSHGHEVQIILKAIHAAAPAVLQESFDGERETVRQLLDTDGDSGRTLLEPVHANADRRKAWKSAFEKLGAVEAARTAYDTYAFEGEWLRPGLRLLYGLVPKDAATEVDYAFFLDLAMHASISKRRVQAAAEAIANKEASSGRSLTPAERRRAIGAVIVQHIGSPQMKHDRMARNVIYSVDEIGGLSEEERDAWLRRSGLRASDCGLSDSRLYQPQFLNPNSPSPTAAERISPTKEVQPPLPEAGIPTVSGGSPDLPAEAVERVRQQFAGRPAHYMAQRCTPTTYPNWEGLPLQRCEYSVTDETGTKSATVILLNAPPEQLARWVVRTCIEAKGSSDPPCTDRLVNHIQSASGAQFPVAGIVFEDLVGPNGKAPRDGVFEVYVFRDGVTVGIRELRNQTTAQPSAEQIKASLESEVVSVGQYARIQSTTVDDYRANGGTENVGTQDHRTLTWLKVVRESYQKAWGTDRNELMIAWARRHLE